MRAAIVLILNLLFLAVAFATGMFLLLWMALAFAGVVIYFVIRQKLTGRVPPFMHIYTFRHTTHSQPPVIDAEYQKIDEK